MQKKLLAVAVLSALSGAVAAQSSSVTLSGVLQPEFAVVGASGATQNSAVGAQSSDVVSRTRLNDGNGSYINFGIVEDLGNGLQAWAQVQSVVMGNSDTRAQTATTLAPAGITVGGAAWGTRNTGVGLRSASWGTAVVGVWDIHYHTEGNIDRFSQTTGSAQTAKSLLHSSGAATPSSGGRYNNVIRWDSPNWNGFTMAAAFARPVDGAVRTTSTPFAGGFGNILDGKKATVWSFNPRYQNGPFEIFYSYIQEKDIVDPAAAGVAALGNYTTNIAALAQNGVAGQTTTTTAFNIAGGAPAAGANTATALAPTVQTVIQVRGDRLGGAWTFPFGLKAGLIWDRQRITGNHQATAAVGAGAVSAGSAALVIGQNFNSSTTRTTWSVPVSYAFGSHMVGVTYTKAGNLNASVDITGVNANGASTGARSWMVGYQYAMSKRTNMYLAYTKISNDALANYDFFANGAGMTNLNRGASPTSTSLGIRHAF